MNIFVSFFGVIFLYHKASIYLLASKSVMKILDINERMVSTMAGGAADCQFWCRVVAQYCK